MGHDRKLGWEIAQGTERASQPAGEELKHDLRNRLAGIRHAAHYIRLKLEGSTLAQEDPRLADLVVLMEDELEAADRLLRKKPARPGVLIVDDEDGIQRTLGGLLGRAGYPVACASSLAAARALMTKQVEFAVVLLDRNLADGLGYELVPAIRTYAPKARILLCSGMSEAGDDETLVDSVVDKMNAYDAALEALRAIG